MSNKKFFNHRNIFRGFSLTISVLLLSFTVNYLAFAWTEPNLAPLGCNSGDPGCDAPINVSGGAQYKSGALGIGGLFETDMDTHLAITGGNVGIGITNPGLGAKLHLKGNNSGRGLIVEGGDTDSAGQNTNIFIQPKTMDQEGNLVFVDWAGKKKALIHTGNNDVTETIAMQFQAYGIDGTKYGTFDFTQFLGPRPNAYPQGTGNAGGGKSRLYINQNGNVGIGNTGPIAKLDVDMANLTTTEGFHISRGVAGSHYAYMNVEDESDNSVFKIHENGNIGIGTDNPQFKLSLDGDGGIFAKGSTGSGATFIDDTIPGARFVWYPRMSALRVGVSNVLLNTDMGVHSIALGRDAIGSNIASVAIGDNSVGSGQFSFAASYSSNASGNFSTAVGSGAKASGAYSNSFGYFTVSNGNYSTAIGREASSNGVSSLALGEYVASDATNSVVIGSGLSSANKLSNNITKSVAIGSNSTTPTLYIRGGGLYQGAGVIQLSGGATVTGFGTAFAKNFMTGDKIRIRPNSPSNPTVTKVVVNVTSDTSLTVDSGIGYSDFGSYDIVPAMLKMGNSNLFANSDGNIGIGTSMPSAKLDVDMTNLTTTEGLHISRDAAASHYSYMNVEDESDNSVFKIHENGNIGVGTQNPQQKLEINSVMRLTPTDTPGVCDAARRGSIYYDDTSNELCDCNGLVWEQVDGGGGC